jgi:hypothetical protein
MLVGPALTGEKMIVKNAVRIARALILAVAASLSSAVCAAPVFTAVPLTSPLGPGNGTFIYSSSADPVAAGSGAAGAASLSGGYQALRWSADGSYTVLGPLGGGASFLQNYATGLNNAGVSVGWQERLASAGGGKLAVRWSPDGTAQLLPGPAGFETVTSEAHAVNNAGQAAGDAHLSGLTGRAIRWSADGTATVLAQTVSGQAVINSYGYDIHDAGQVTGYAVTSPGGARAVRWGADGVGTRLGDVPGMSAQTRSTQAFALNEVGGAAGFAAFDVIGDRAVRWAPDGTATRLADVPGGTMIRSFAYGIDNAGRAVGLVQRSGLFEPSEQAALWDTDGTALLLKNLMSTSGWFFSGASGIDSNDQFIRIVAEGSHPSINNGFTTEFLLTAPVPEPGAVALFALVTPLAASRRRPRSR